MLSKMFFYFLNHKLTVCLGLLDFLFMQFHTVELYLCQITLFDNKRHPQDHQQQFNSPVQVEALCMGLSAGKSVLDFYISLPLRAEMAFNNTGCIQIGFALTLACKLAVAALEPPVNLHTAVADLSRSLDMSGMLNRCILRIQALITLATDSGGDRDVFFHYEKRLKRIQAWYETRKQSGPAKRDNIHYPLQPKRVVAQQATPPSIDGGQGHCFDTPHRPMDGGGGFSEFNANPIPQALTPHDVFDMRWPGFFPDVSIDDIFSDWMAQPTASFEQQYNLGR